MPKKSPVSTYPALAVYTALSTVGKRGKKESSVSVLKELADPCGSDSAPATARRLFYERSSKALWAVQSGKVTAGRPSSADHELHVAVSLPQFPPL